jgi:hypothetical protein
VRRGAEYNADYPQQLAYFHVNRSH